MGSGNMNLPPGFYFSPTDEELVLHFLYSKASLPCHPNIIPDLDLSLLDPWEFNGKALSSGNQHYFFTEKKGNRSTENGYWKEIGVTNSIFSSDADNKVGIKKYLVFNLGKAPQGTETNWVMEEYHICSSGFNTASCGSTRRRRNSVSDFIVLLIKTIKIKVGANGFYAEYMKRGHNPNKVQSGIAMRMTVEQRFHG
ncbi:NAC domain [Sesbania bispinosa]|nr:NAC domain [Sesbania bispinosa]